MINLFLYYNYLSNYVKLKVLIATLSLAMTERFSFCHVEKSKKLVNQLIVEPKTLFCIVDCVCSSKLFISSKILRCRFVFSCKFSSVVLFSSSFGSWGSNVLYLLKSSWFFSLSNSSLISLLFSFSISFDFSW